MAKKKSLKHTNSQIEKLRAELEEAMAKKDEQIKEMNVKLFSSVFEDEKICEFCDKNARNKQFLAYVVDETKKLLLKTIEDMESGALQFEDPAEAEKVNESTEKIEKETELSSEEEKEE